MAGSLKLIFCRSLPLKIGEPLDLSSLLHLPDICTTWVIGGIYFGLIVAGPDTALKWNVVGVRHFKSNGRVPAKCAYSPPGL